MRGLRPPGNVWIGVAGLDLVRDQQRRVARARGQRPHAERVRLPARHAPRAARAHRRPAGRDAAPARRRDRSARRRPARRRARERARPPRAAGGGADRRRAQLGLLGARLALAPARHPAGRAATSSRCATASCGCSPRGLREPRRIDVIYRRTNADRLDSDIGRLLIEPVRAGRLGLVNQYGTGVADDKLTHAYVEQMIRFYVGEEPVLRSVPTYDLAQPEQLEEALDVFDELVLKPRAGHGGVGVLIAPHAEREDIEATRAAVIAAPSDWIAQRMVMLSTHPTVVEGGRLAPRHIDLRPFVFLGEGCTPRVLPGRPDPRRALRGRAGRQLVPERRREGHLGHALTARSQRPAKPRRTSPSRSSSPSPASAARASSGRPRQLGERAAAVLDRVEQPPQRRRERGRRRRRRRLELPPGRSGEQVEHVGGVAHQRRAGVDQAVGARRTGGWSPGPGRRRRCGRARRRSRRSSASRSARWPARRSSTAPSAAMIRLRATKHQRWVSTPGGSSEITAPRSATAAWSRQPRAG